MPPSPSAGSVKAGTPALAVVSGRVGPSPQLLRALDEFTSAGGALALLDLGGSAPARSRWNDDRQASIRHYRPVERSGPALPWRRARFSTPPELTSTDGGQPHPMATLLESVMDVLVTDEWAAKIVTRATPDRPIPYPWRAAERARTWVRVQQLASDVAQFPASGIAQIAAAAQVAAGFRDLQALPEEYTRPLARHLPMLGEALARSSRPRALDDLVQAAGELWGRDEVDHTGLPALAAAAALSTAAAQPDDLQQLVAVALEGADAAFDDGDLIRAGQVTNAALRLLFHPSLHAEAARSPIIDDPVGYLQVFTDSAVGRLLTGLGTTEGGHQPPQPIPATPETAATTVAVVPGSYPQFATGLVRALQEGENLTCSIVEPAAEEPVLQYLGVNTEVLTHCLTHASGIPVSLAPNSAAALADADIVVIDWADRAAWWATVTLPARTRLVVRVHAADALSPWILMMDWSRVDDLIFVSPSFRDVVVDMLGERLRNTRVHVVPSGVDLTEFTPGDVPEQERAFTLGMIGWGRPVKDPLFAVETLALLRQHDQRWRLLLVGSDLSELTTPAGRQYRQRFETRVAAADVSEAVDRVPPTTEVARYAQQMSHVISSSRREGLPFAVLEAVACGAVPVVRDWPALASRNGARRVFPPEWVVENPAEAAERVLATAADRQALAAQARAHVVQTFGAAAFSDRIRAVVLGSHQPS